MTPDEVAERKINEAAVDRLVRLHQEEFDVLVAEERARLTSPESPDRLPGIKVDLPDAEIIRRYVDGASCRTLAKSYGVAKSTIELRIPKHLRRLPGAPRLRMGDDGS